MPIWSLLHCQIRYFETPDFTNAHFSNLDLYQADLSHTELSQRQIQRADEIQAIRQVVKTEYFRCPTCQQNTEYIKASMSELSAQRGNGLFIQALSRLSDISGVSELSGQLSGGIWKCTKYARVVKYHGDGKTVKVDRKRFKR